MKKPLTVRKMLNRLQKLVDEGHGAAPVLSASMNPAQVKFFESSAVYIGPSPYDSKTYRLDKPDGKGTVIV